RLAALDGEHGPAGGVQIQADVLADDLDGLAGNPQGTVQLHARASSTRLRIRSKAVSSWPGSVSVTPSGPCAVASPSGRRDSTRSGTDRCSTRVNETDQARRLSSARALKLSLKRTWRMPKACAVSLTIRYTFGLPVASVASARRSVDRRSALSWKRTCIVTVRVLGLKPL